jgi:eukaryotic-like serine/threonine-protein kinase
MYNLVDKTILHYKIIEQVGQGGMGVVYKAEDLKLKRDVAVKFLPHHISINEDEKQRFEIEAQAAASLNHPNIATIFSIEEAEGEMFIVMEYINGKELKEIVRAYRDKPLTVNYVINYAVQIAEGLQAAHSKGIIHRDIKSSNIMVTEDGKIKIMDFGLAKIGKGKEVTQAGLTVGTIAYMSPEQTKGDDIDHRTDIWSYGIVLYEMITGELPFKGEYDQATIYSILNEDPPIIIKEKDDNSLFEIVKKSLKKDREKRYNQFSEIIEELKSGKPYADSKHFGKGEIKKLAVLPFSNILDDPKTNFLGFALADQVIGSMAYSKSLLVRPSSTIRKYQNEIIDIQKAGSELNVNFILTGNYLKEEDIIRLNIELVELESEKMLWRESIQIKYSNVFELQDIVSQKVVDGLNLQFSEEERKHMNPGTPQNSVAYEFYLRALSYPQTVEGTKLAIEMLNNSVRLDPDFPLSYLELGSRYNQLSQVGEGSVDAAGKAEEALKKALSLKNDLLPALAYLGLIYTDIGRHEEAHSLLTKALIINPNDSWLHFALAYHYRYIGFLEESEKEIETALSIDPKNPRFRSSIITYMYLGKYDYALGNFNLDMESPFVLNFMGEISFRKGDNSSALKYFEKSASIKEEVGEFYFASSFIEFINGNKNKAAEFNLKRELKNPVDGEIWYEIARVYGLLNKKDDCYRALKKSIEMGFISYPAMERDSFLDTVRQDEDIQNILSTAKMKHEELKEKLLISSL